MKQSQTTQGEKNKQARLPKNGIWKRQESDRTENDTGIARRRLACEKIGTTEKRDTKREK